MKEAKIVKIDNVIQLRQPDVKAKEVKKIGSVMMHDNHRMYEFNKVNFQLDFASYEDVESSYVVGGMNTVSKKIIVREHCFYFTALNEENAIKKVNARFNPDFVAVMIPE